MIITRAALAAVLVLGLLAAPLATEAQSSGKVARVGYLTPGHEGGRVDANAPTGFNMMRQGLRDIGWIEGQTVIFEPRFARDEANKLPTLANELVGIPVDVLLTVGTAATHAATNATTAIPIVMYVGDPVAAGFVASL